MTSGPTDQPYSSATAVGPAPQGGELADRVEAAVLTVAGVVGLHGGPFGEVATLLPGRRVRGVRLEGPGGRSEVHVVASTTRGLGATAADVHDALAALVPGPVHVVVGDVLTPAEQASEQQSQQDRSPVETSTTSSDL